MSDLLDLGDGLLDASGRWRLPVAGEFNLGATVRLLQRRPKNPIDRWENGCYLRALHTAEGLRLAAVMNTGTIDAPDLRLHVFGGAVNDETVQAVIATIRGSRGLDADPAPTAWLEEMEPRFGPVTAALRGFRSPCFPGLWETRLAVLPFQQFSLDAGIAILGRLVERFSPPLMLAGRAWFDFPAPEAIAEASPAALTDVGLSQAKANAVQALARRAMNSDLDTPWIQAFPTDDALKALQALPGIGPWSASVLLLRGLRRMDVFPPGDTGTARNLTALLGRSVLLTPAETSAFAARFGDRRGYLYFIFLGNRLMADGLASAD